MITLDEMQEMLDELACQLPEEIYRDLNGGIILLPDTKLCPEARNNDLYTLGEYRSGGPMGRYIVFYYGSFRHLFGDRSPEAIRKELDITLKHEFTHHLEHLAGLHGLDDEDDAFMEEYLCGKPGYRSPRIRNRTCRPYSYSGE